MTSTAEASSPEVAEVAAPAQETIPIQAPPAPVEEKEPLVDLDEGADDRPTIRYKKKLYELKVLDDFGIRMQQRLTREGREFFRLWQADEDLSDEDGAELERLLEHMFSQVVDEELRAANLSDGQKAQCVLGFTLAPLARRMAQAQEKTETDQEAGESEPTTGS